MVRKETYYDLRSIVWSPDSRKIAAFRVKRGQHRTFLLVPGMRHSPGGPYGERKRYDFFVHYLLGVEPPDWNESDGPALSTQATLQ